MGENTLIEWATHTFNPWRGCTKVSAGCKNCYAENLSARNPAVLGEWGPDGTRVVAGEAVWRQPLAWDRKAWQAGERHRVFCASLADVFESWRGSMVRPNGEALFVLPSERTTWGLGRDRIDCRLTMADVRRRLADLIRRTPNLDWLLLTKRPQNAAGMLAEMFGPDRSTWPTNFRVGTSVEDQEAADERLPHLLALNWPNFVSAEPLLGPVDIRPFLQLDETVKKCHVCGFFTNRLSELSCPNGCGSMGRDCRLDWIIVGGESGPGARPMHPAWVRDIRDQCAAAGLPFLFKQWGEWLPFDMGPAYMAGFHEAAVIANGPGATGWPVYRVGKKAAGRTLDGVIHDGYPEPTGVAP